MSEKRSAPLRLERFERIDERSRGGPPVSPMQMNDLRAGRILVPGRLLEGCSGLAFTVSSLEDGVFALLAEWMHGT